MTEIKLEISPENLKTAVAESLLLSMSGDQKESLIKQAIIYLLTPGKGYGSDKATPIEDAFKNAISGVAHQIAREMLADAPEVKEKISAVLADSFTYALETQREATVEKIGNSIVEAMECRHKDRY